MENGIGGHTFKAEIYKYELKEGKKAGSGFSLLVIAKGNGLGNTTIQLSISPSGNAIATVGGGVQYQGELFAINTNSVFKGHTH